MKFCKRDSSDSKHSLTFYNAHAMAWNWGYLWQSRSFKSHHFTTKYEWEFFRLQLAILFVCNNSFSAFF